MADPEESTLGRRQEILTYLRGRDAAVGITEIADQVGVHVNTVRFHLERLVAGGQVERVASEHAGPGRPALLFAAVRAMDPTGPRHYEMLADMLVSGLAAEDDASGRALRAGLAWGRRQASVLDRDKPRGTKRTRSKAAVEGLTRVLARMDFAPEVRREEGVPVIDLRHCPFLDLAGTRSEIVCPVHLGLMRGILESWQAPLTVQRLDPFVEPDRCTAHLAHLAES